MYLFPDYFISFRCCKDSLEYVRYKRFSGPQLDKSMTSDDTNSVGSDQSLTDTFDKIEAGDIVRYGRVDQVEIQDHGLLEVTEKIRESGRQGLETRHSGIVVFHEDYISIEDKHGHSGTISGLEVVQ